MKGYFIFNGVEYFGYEIYTTDGSLGPGNFCTNLRSFLEEDGQLSKMCQQINPPVGASLYVSPNCQIAAEDIRHNYMIKKKVDTGDYNVFHPCSKSEMWDNAYSVAIIPGRKVLIANTDYYKRNSDIKNIIFNLFPDYNPGTEETVVFQHNIIHYSSYSLISYTVHQSVLDFLDGKLTKPCVWYKSLWINNSEEITEDLLDLVYKTATVSENSRTAIDNYKIQLHALNQHNWRERPGTVALLLHGITRPKGSRNVRNYVAHYKSEWDKPIRQLMENHDVKFKNKEDFELARNFVAKLMNMEEGTRFVTVQDVVDKCEQYGLTLDDFSNLFNVCVRIKDKDYQNE